MKLTHNTLCVKIHSYISIIDLQKGAKILRNSLVIGPLNAFKKGAENHSYVKVKSRSILGPMPNVFSLAATFCETFHSIQLFCHESAVETIVQMELFIWAIE